MKKRRKVQQPAPKARPKAKASRRPVAPPRAAATVTAAAAEATRVRQEKLAAQAWRLASRFGHVLGVEPYLVFEPTRGQARVETVRHLVAHVLLEVDRVRPTDLRVAMGRDRQTLRNSFKRAWDLREDPEVETLINFVSETRRARFKDFRRATKRACATFEEVLTPSGRGGRFQPDDFLVALREASRALAGAPPQRLASPATPSAERASTQAPTRELPAAAKILEASPLTRRVLGDPQVVAEATSTGGARVSVSGRALKGDMRKVSNQLAAILEAAGFSTTEEGVFEVPGKKSWRAVLRVAPTMGV